MLEGHTTSYVAQLRAAGWTHISQLGASGIAVPATWLHKDISDTQWWTAEEAQVITGIMTLRAMNGAGVPTQDEIERILCIRDYSPVPPEMI